MLLSGSRPQDLVRCAAVFGELAQDVGQARASAVQSSHVVWLGRAGDAYQQELSHLAARLQTVQAAYDEACDVLLRYARELEPARDLARVAEAVTAAAEQERVAAVVSGGLLGSLADDGLARGAALLREAEQAQARAAAVAIAGLEDLTARSPRSGSSADRFLSQTVRGLWGSIVGTGELAVTAVRSLPLVGSGGDRQAARRELAAEAEAMVQPWLLVEQLLQQFRDGQGGQAVGAALGMAITHKLGVSAKDARLFGTYAALPDEVVRAVREVGPEVTGDAWVLAREQRLLYDDLVALGDKPLPVGRHILNEPVDVLHHEAHGGHTLLKHIGREVAFLLERQRLLQPWKQNISSFTSLAEANRAVQHALTTDTAKVLRWLASDQNSLEVVVALPESTPGRLVNKGGDPAPATHVIVRLDRDRYDRVLIKTAYVEKVSSGKTRG